MRQGSDSTRSVSRDLGCVVFVAAVVTSGGAHAGIGIESCDKATTPGATGARKSLLCG
jgi:hypothetical protein